MSRITGTSMKRIILSGALALLGLAPFERVAGQGYGWNNLKGEVFAHLDLTFPVGDFRKHVEMGVGAGFGGVLFLGQSRLAGLRAEGGFVVYGGERARVPFSPTVPLVEVDMRTTNSILTGGLGPQFFLGTGPIRPYVYGTVGAAYFVTSTSVSGTHDDEPIAETTNFDDFQLSLTGGGGLSVRIRGGPNALSLDASASYQHNGLTRYMVDGARNLRPVRGGGWVAEPIVGDANLTTYRVGVSVGVG